MKTIFIILGGLADRPEARFGGRTPLMEAYTPSLDALAKCGCCGPICNIPEGVEPTTANAVLALLGYDFSRGIPSEESLRELGDGEKYLQDDLRYFIMPKFSGHGVVVSDDSVVRGIGMMSLLRPLYPVGETVSCTETNPCGSLHDKARLAVKAIELFDFVLIYVNEAELASLDGNPQKKILAIEDIDRELITPVADYVWNAKLQMNLVVTGDHITSWKTKSPEPGEVPAVVYFNDDLPYDTDTFDENAVEEGPLNAPLPGDLMKLLVTFEPFPPDDSGTPSI